MNTKNQRLPNNYIPKFAEMEKICPFGNSNLVIKLKFLRLNCTFNNAAYFVKIS